MYRIRDFYGKNIINEKGKIIGKVVDIIIDINNCNICGFSGKKNGLFSKEFYVLKKDLIYIGESIVTRRLCKKEMFTFNKIKGMEVVNLKGDVIGILEDILFCEEEFKILGLMLCENFFKNYVVGKRIVLLKDIILGESEVLFINKQPYYFYSKLNFSKDKGECDEKN
ncbi:PRC-barrel domain-containing protein [Hathewaya histolytica]|uniref:PRC-barrel domain-containing protein n=1 Tax=Hathewaya histolytica TaxID=1498 RepID=A0A4U9RF08_HATHI|nr:PRC-barrel domain-containing protein [Hathewaya histolytica]VTQ90432.1 PRC-barrel domain-containing protein [Hathewaya histolytica]